MKTFGVSCNLSIVYIVNSLVSTAKMVKIILNTLLGLILIFIWSRFVNLGQIASTLSSANLAFLGPVFLFMLLSPIIRAIRLKIFLSEVKTIALKDLIFLNGVAMCLNFFIPIRAGEIAKGIYLNTRYKLNLGKSIIWIFLDRFVDFLGVLMLASLLLNFVPTKLPKSFSLTVGAVFIVALILTYLAIYQVKLARKLINFLRSLLIEKHIKIYFDKVSRFLLESFSILNRHPKDLAALILITILAYAADAAIWYFTFISLNSHQLFWKMYLGQLLSALTYLIPAAPGYIGSAEASGLLVLSGIFGIDSNLASAMTVLFHIASAIFVIIYGLISIFSLKIDLRLIFDKALKRR